MKETLNREDILPKRTLLQRLAWVQTKVDYVQKEKKSGMKYSIVSHDAVTAKVRPLMVEAGVIYYPFWMEMTQVGNRTQMKLTVRFVSVDDDADYIDVVSAGYGIDDQDKGPGKAISYSVKYALLKCLGLESGDDPDYDQQTTHEDPNDPHTVAMLEFEAAIEIAATIEELNEATSRFRVQLEQAKAANPVKWQMARAAWSKKAAQLRQG